MCTKKDDVEKIVDIIRDAGGKLVGRTRLQKRPVCWNWPAKAKVFTLTTIIMAPIPKSSPMRLFWPLP